MGTVMSKTTETKKPTRMIALVRMAKLAGLRTKQVASIACSVFGMMGAISGQQAQASFTFTKIADASTTDPSGGTFGYLGDPSLSGSNVAFLGFNSTGAKIGVYISKSGTISKIADLKTTDPSGNTFTDFGNVSVSGSTVGFVGMYNNGSYKYTTQGYYTGTGGALTTMADIKTAVPNTTKKFNDFSGNVAGTTFVFAGNTSLGTNIYGVQNGVLSVQVDTTTSDPSGGKFTTLYDVMSNANNDILFNGYSSSTQIQGLYKKSGSTISTIVDTTMADPSGGTFGPLGAPVFAGSNVIFYSYNPTTGIKGLYEKTTGGFVKIADTNTVRPRVGGPFSFVYDYSGSSNGLVFVGNNASESSPGIYTTLPGALTSVIEAGDILGGKTVSDLTLSPTAMDGTTFAFHVTFTDSTEAIYTVKYQP